VNLRLLEIFRAVMESHTTLGAARSLQISQPAVSTAVRQLETQLGLALFDRRANRLVAREEAKILFEQSDSIFLMLHTLSQTAEELKENRYGHVRVAATPQLGHTVLPTAIQGLLAQRPNVKVFFDVRRSYTVVEKVESGAADLGLAIALEPELSSSVQMIPIASISMVCVMREQHPLAQATVLRPAQLAQHALIGLEMGSRLGPLVRGAFKSEQTPYRIHVEVRYSETACLLAKAGAGIAIVDTFSAIAHAQPGSGMKIIPFQPDIQLDTWAILAKHRTASRLSMTLVDLLQQCTRQYLDDAIRQGLMAG
jgi:DNA-binding transcriptional LysR family regulator